MRLNIELMPESCWGQSLRARMTKYQWQRLRQRVLDEQGEQCAICGAGGRLQCHEVWLYDDLAHVQKLIGLEMLCGMCHGVEHYGMTNQLAAQGSVSLSDYQDHFCRVNGVTAAAFTECHDEARRVQAERSKHEWTTDLGAWAKLATQEPATVSRRNADLDGALQLPGSAILSASSDANGNVTLMISGITHHPPAIVHGRPRFSPSVALMRMILASCNGWEKLRLPADIVDAAVEYGEESRPWLPQPLSHEGRATFELTLDDGDTVRLVARGIQLDRAVH